MQNFIIAGRSFARIKARALAATSLLLVFASGCVSYTPTTSTSDTNASPQNYFAPRVEGGAAATGTYTFDSAKGLFYYSTFQIVGVGEQEGAETWDVGSYSADQRGLRDLSLSTIAGTSITPVAGGFALELAGQAGGLVQMSSASSDTGDVATPLVAANACPNSTTAQTYQFISIPGVMYAEALPTPTGFWSPSTDTAYGSVDVSGNGSTISFKNIVQKTLPSEGGTGSPTYPSDSSMTGACGSNYSGYLTSIPAVNDAITITSSNDEYLYYPPQATVGIGPTGLLVEDNGYSLVSDAVQYPTYYQTVYQNSLGAGTGAIGLPKPSSALSTSAVVGAQYLGFIYSPGYPQYSGYDNDLYAIEDLSSHLASFSYSGSSSECATFATQTGTLSNGIYGGDFANDDPSTSSDEFGNCDFAIDLGAEDTTNYGLYTQVKVWMDASYPGNSTGATYWFPAVAIAGQLNGKYAIFVLGVDSTQPWSIDLLQSN
jgi:hypothetical protein